MKLDYTQSRVAEEQALFPRHGVPSPDLSKRDARLAVNEFPILRQAGVILFDQFNRRYKEGLGLIQGDAPNSVEEEHGIEFEGMAEARGRF